MVGWIKKYMKKMDGWMDKKKEKKWVDGQVGWIEKNI